MDKYARAYFEATFKSQFLDRNGNSFQDMFCDIMEKCHPGDFIPVKPWGSAGDHKNDGYLRSMRTLFQVYAPENLRGARVKTKIMTDFAGALPYWRDYFDTWIFVHNSKKGLPPDVVSILLQLGAEYPQIHIAQWGFEELRQKIFSLAEVDVVTIFGPLPSAKDMVEVRYSDIEDVVTAIEESPFPHEQEIRPVPRNKLSYNQLAQDAEVLLTWGMRKAHLVGDFFNSWNDPEYGDRIAAAFKRKYMSYRELQMPPDEIFHHLHEFAAGSERQLPRREAAALAVLAFLFEQCDIFERPPAGAVS